MNSNNSSSSSTIIISDTNLFTHKKSKSDTPLTDTQ